MDGEFLQAERDRKVDSEFGVYEYIKAFEVRTNSQARTDVVIQFASIPERKLAKIDVEILQAGKRRSYSYSGQNCADRRVFFE